MISFLQWESHGLATFCSWDAMVLPLYSRVIHYIGKKDGRRGLRIPFVSTFLQWEKNIYLD